MIDKKLLSSIIDKYYLKGLCDSVIWKIKDNNLVINFISKNSDMIGKIEATNFPLKDTELAIYDTSLLDRQLQITSGNINLDVISKGKINTKLIFSDAQFNIQFSLADTLLIPSVARVEEPEIYHVIADLDFEAISAMIRAKNALPKINTVIFNLEQDLYDGYNLVVNFGDINDYSNKISYNINSVEVQGIIDLNVIFNSDLLKEILDANKGASNAQMSIFDKGLIKLEFNDETVSSTYYLVCKEN
jgi:hypothetical protein